MRLALRALRRTPVVSTVAVLSLALGIGANTALFSIVNSLMLRDLPVKDPARLALVTDAPGPVAPTGAPWRNQWTYAVWEQVRARAAAFDAAAAYATARLNLGSGVETDLATGLWVSGRFFEMLGVSPTRGRALAEADDRRGGGPDGAVAVLSHDFWQRRFAGRHDIVGRVVTVERVPFTIIGVTPPSFFGPTVGEGFDLALPIGTEPLVRGADSSLDQPARWWLSLMVRLKPGQSIAAGTQALRVVQPQIRDIVAAGLPPTLVRGFLETPFTLIPADSRVAPIRQRYERPLLIVLAVVVLVLLVASANIANLLLGRAAARQHEFSLQRALGASSWRVVRQPLVEAAVIAAGGASLGLLVAQQGSRLLVGQLSSQARFVFLDLSLDWRVLGFTSVVALTTVLLSSAAPALRASRAAPLAALKDAGRGGLGGAGGTGGLLVVQVAISLVLVVATGLFGRSFVMLVTRDLGFDRSGVLLATVNSLPANVAPALRPATFERVRQAIAAVPGAATVAVSSVTPVLGAVTALIVDVSGSADLPERQRQVYVNYVSPGWFSTYGVPLLAGRDVGEDDRTASPHVAVVNEAFARRFLAGRSPVGHVIVQSPMFGPARPKEIVGLVGDAVYRDVRESVPPTIFVPLTQSNRPSFFPALTVSVRSASDPAMLTQPIAAAVADVHPHLTVTFRTLDDQIEATLGQDRLLAMLSGFFGSLSLLMAGLGLYGVTSYAVSRRHAELGIRLALGATPRSVAWFVVSRVMVLVAIGLGVGAVIAWWVTIVAAPLLYGLEPRDGATFAGAVAVLVIVSALAACVPAIRAARTDPSATLRA